MAINTNFELDAVNHIITAIGESPINTLENCTNVDVINAYRILLDTNRQFQSRGWSFNMISSITLNPDTYTKRILWRSDLLMFKASDGNRYVKREGYVFNFTEQTFLFSGVLEGSAILLTEFEEMPEQAKEYIKAQAARRFQATYLGDSTLSEELNRQEQEKWGLFNEYEMDMNNYNIYTNTGIAEVLSR